MKIILKIILWAVMVTLLIPCVSFGIYDALYFQPYKTEIKQFIAAATEEERLPPPVVVNLIHVAYNGINLPSFSSRLVLYSLDVHEPNHGQLHWHAKHLLWTALFYLHLSEQEQITIVASKAFMGNHIYGLSAAAQKLFNRPLSLLSVSEAATIVAIPHAPTSYTKRPELLVKRRDLLLSELAITRKANLKPR